MIPKYCPWRWEALAGARGSRASCILSKAAENNTHCWVSACFRLYVRCRIPAHGKITQSSCPTSVNLISHRHAQSLSRGLLVSFKETIVNITLQRERAKESEKKRERKKIQHKSKLIFSYLQYININSFEWISSPQKLKRCIIYCA